MSYGFRVLLSVVLGSYIRINAQNVGVNVLR